MRNQIPLDGTAVLDQPNCNIQIIKYEENTVLGLVDAAIGASLENGNFDLAWEVMEKFRAMNKASSLGAAKLLHGVKTHWEEVDSEEGETFVQQAVRRTGYSELTIGRYISVWELLSGNIIPEEFFDAIWSQTMRQLVKEASLVVDQGYELDHDDWRDLSEAIDEQRTAEVCARVKGKPRNSNHMSLKIDEDGYIKAYKNGDECLVGQLFVASEDPIVQKAVKRIMDSSGITPRNEY